MIESASQTAVPGDGGLWSRIVGRSLFLPLALMLGFTLIIVSPAGDFPLQDDNFHFRPVKHIVETGTFQKNPYMATTFVAQGYWGALFAKVFGMSYTSLRASTLVAALVGAWAAARCAGILGASRGTAILCGLLVLFNPIYMSLSYTFMSEVPFTAVVTLAGLSYLAALRSDHWGYAVLGTALALVAFFIRQHGAFVSGAFGAVFVIQWAIFRERPSIKLFGATLTSGCVFAAVVAWWVLTDGFTESQSSWFATRSAFGSLVGFLRDALWFTAAVIVYLGLFTLPINAARAIQGLGSERRWSKARWIATTLAGAVLLAITVLVSTRMTGLPYFPPILRDMGLGAYMITDVWFDLDRTWEPIRFGGVVWWPITFAAVGSAAVLLVDAWGILRKGMMKVEGGSDRQGTNRLRLFLVLWIAAYIFSYMPFLPRSFSDRFFITAMVPAVILAASYLQWQGKAAMRCALTLLVAFVAFDLVGVQSYMAYSRARWAAVDYLIDDLQVDPLTVDGGFEYNSTYTLDAFMEAHNIASFGEFGDRGWWVMDDTYAISYHPREGYEEIHRIPYRAWMGWQNRAVRVLQRTD
jgi:hypothetical protein